MGNREPHEAKKKSFGLGGNRTHDLRIRSTVTLPTELQGRTEKVGDDFRWWIAAKRKYGYKWMLCRVALGTQIENWSLCLVQPGPNESHDNGIRSFHPMVISPQVILPQPKVTSLHTQNHFAPTRVTLLHTEATFDKFAGFSVKGEGDNLFVSTWSQMQIITEVNDSESSQFVRELHVSESTQNTLANRLGTLANWTFNSETTC